MKILILSPSGPEVLQYVYQLPGEASADTGKLPLHISPFGLFSLTFYPKDLSMIPRNVSLSLPALNAAACPLLPVSPRFCLECLLLLLTPPPGSLPCWPALCPPRRSGLEGAGPRAAVLYLGCELQSPGSFPRPHPRPIKPEFLWVGPSFLRTRSQTCVMSDIYEVLIPCDCLSKHVEKVLHIEDYSVRKKKK